MPASFKGYNGKVVYFLEAKLCRSMSIPKKAKVYFNYVPRGDTSVPDLMVGTYISVKVFLKLLGVSNQQKCGLGVLIEKLI